MDKKSIIGLVLIFAIFVGYMFWVQPSPEQRRVNDSLRRVYMDSIDSLVRADSVAAAAALAAADSAASVEEGAEATLADMGAFTAAQQGDDRAIEVGSERLQITLHTLGARLDRVVLNDYRTYDSLPLELISPADDNMNLVFSTEDNSIVSTSHLVFAPYVDGQPWDGGRIEVQGGDSVVIGLRAYIGGEADSLAAAGGHYLEFAYTVHGTGYNVGFDIRFVGLEQTVRNTPYMDFSWHNRMMRQEKVNSGSRGKGNRNGDRERFYSNIYYKTPTDKSVDNLRMGQDGAKQVKTDLQWIAFKQQFFCAVLNTKGEPFGNADIAVSTNAADTAKHYLTDMAAIIGLPFDGGNSEIRMDFYLGPTKYRDLRRMHSSYEKMLPLGWWHISKFVSRVLIIPTFNFLEKLNWNYGIIVIIFTLLLRGVLFPLTFKSYQGSAIMRILRPEMEALNKKYPRQEDAMQKQQAMMALQRKAGYNPMAGCLPVLLQMPVWTAMFMFFPIAIELRQKGFLWCDDLSTYDSILDLGFNIPLYGDHVSLFCLLMFAVQFFYTWYTMKDQQAQASMPGMKFMMYFMPFMMLFIFNNQSAALCLYQFISISFTMVSMILIRRFTSEKKVRARIAAYDQKHSGKQGQKKKSTFQRRLEELQKQAEQMQRDQGRRK